MPLISGFVIFAWLQVASPSAGIAYDKLSDSENKLANPSFEVWSDASPGGWVVEATKGLNARADKVVGSIDGSGLRIEITDYQSGSVALSSPTVTKEPNTAYFFKAFYITDTVVDLVLEETDNNGNNTYTHLHHYPDYDYPLSSMSSFIEPKESTRAFSVVVVVHGEGYIELDSSYVRELERGPIEAQGGANNLKSATWSFQKGSKLLGSGTSSQGVFRTEVKNANESQAGWVPSPQPLKPHELYEYTFEYRSDQPVDIGYDYQDASGNYQYVFVQTLSPAAFFTQQSFNIEAPADARNLQPSVQLDRSGLLEVRNQTLIKRKEAATYNKPRISITFDDGWASSWENVQSALDEHSFKATYYVNPGTTNKDLFLNSQQIEQILNEGHQIASHTQNHIDITSYLGSYVAQELDEAIRDLREDYSVGTIDFASPFGKFDQSVIPLIADRHATHRGTDPGINTKQQTDYYNLKALFLRKEVSDQELRDYIERAEKSNGWLILIYHQIEPLDTPFALGQERFAKHMQIVKDSGIDVVTVRKAAEQLEAQ